jgi:hypothetical protein
VLGFEKLLGAPARSTAEALSGLADIGDEFERCYCGLSSLASLRRV